MWPEMWRTPWARPAAPLTAYLLGVAVGRGQPLPDTAVKIRDLAGVWASQADN